MQTLPNFIDKTQKKDENIKGIVKKFGLKYNDLPTMVWNVNFFLKFIAIDIDPGPKRPTRFICWVWLIFLLGCYFYIYLVSMLWFVFWRCQETGDILTAILVFSLSTASGISVSKFIYVVFKRKEIQELVADYLRCDSQVVPGSRFAANLKPTLRAAKKRAIFVWNVFILNGTIYAFMALFKSGRQMPEDKFEFLGVQDMKAYPVYEILFTVNAVAIILTACYPAANITALILVLTGYTEAQILALSEELTHLWNDAVTEFNKNNAPNFMNSDDTNFQLYKDADKIINNNHINKRLIEIVNMHVVNMKLLEKYENIFRSAMVIEFIFVIMCIIAELLGGLDKTYIEMPFSLLFLASDCFTGQRIIDASRAFEKAIYHSNWEHFNVANRKIVLLMLQNSQKTMMLSAGGVTKLSHETLMKVIRIIYSAYTTFRSTLK